MSSRILGVLLGTFLTVLLVFPASAQKQRPRHYALILEDQPVADRFPTRAATQTVAAENYRGQIRARQANLEQELRSRDFAVVGAVDTLSNAVFVATSPDRVDELKALPGVKGVIAMRRVKPRMNGALTLHNVPGAWAAIPGGQSNAGAGMKIAVIGSGIDQTHPAFQDPTLSMPSGFPKCTAGHPEDCAYTNNKVIVARSYVRQLSVGSSTDSTKVADDSGPDDYSPRDRSGHSTAIASIIAGNQVTAPAASFSGVAPKAWLGNYRVENSPGMPGGGGQSFEDIYVQALNDAFNDGMQIANLSAGVIATTGPMDTGAACGQASGVPCDYLAFNFEKAAEKGMVITVSAGNDGENGYQFPVTFNMISSPANAPSVIAVGATMNNHVLMPGVSVVGGPSTLQNLNAQTSDAYSSYIGATVWPVVDAAKAGNDGFACKALPQYSLYQAVAIIQQGGNCDFSTKAGNAAAAGASGIIFYMASGAATPVETQDANQNVPLYGPVVMLSQADGQALKTYVDAHPGSQVLMDAEGWEMDVKSYNDQVKSLYPPGFQPSLTANLLLGFSSPGPNAGDLSIKPDIVAVGGSDQTYGPALNATDVTLQDYSFFMPNALYMATQNFDQSSDMYSANGYIAASGTSFSAPMVAGAAALLWQLHPSYNAAQIKALLMNTAALDVVSDNWGDNLDALNVGSGRLDALAATKSSVIAQVVTSDGTNPVSISFGAVTKLPLSKQIQITALGAASQTLTVSVTAPVDVNGGPATGTTAAVDKTSVTVAGGASTTVTLTLSGSVPTADEYTGSVNITGTGVSIHVPYLLLVASGAVWDIQAMQYGQSVSSYYGGCFESLPGGDAGPIGIKLIDQSGVPIANSAVTFTVSPRNSATLKSVSGEPACSPSSSTSTTTCNTDAYGIAWVDIFGGNSSTLQPLVTAKSGNLSVLFGGTNFDGTPCGIILDPPNVTGIAEAAVGSTKIAAGSYISIYGANLADTPYVGNNTFYGGDGPTFIPLPMNLDYVTATFDIPGAYSGKPADYNGSPALFTFVAQSGKQLNVMIPWELQGASQALVKVTVDGFVDSNVLTIPLVQYAPQLFQNGGLAAAIDLSTYAASPGAVSATNAVHAGDIVELYANGLGPVNNQPASGAGAPSDPAKLATTKTPCTVTVGGQNAAVGYCGLAPGFPALFQVNITIPSGLAAGNQAVVLSVGGVSSASTNLPVK